ncbi:AAA family ATPase [Actinocatenispora rupis]|uniref:ATPase AAA-type core domain-containing protein n=1 Tax=Actinocatenispora rupis TaxID=519421 RepID=A0A8J3J5A4_9ACTN|nr:AAA family ATPase [Actinocatenispora rupis]GID12227.1 hypothetical protein Aru02nite_31160 [Actinocatenispora rupis]
MRRVLVVGGPGSGKTTLARTLATALGVPHHDLDRVAYRAGAPDAPFHDRVRVGDDVRRASAADIAATEGWVADGLYAGWTGPLRDAADLIVWLDPPARVALCRVLRRAVAHRCRGGRDWDLRSVWRVARGARSYRSRPVGTADELRARDSANGSRTLAAFLRPAADTVVRCGSAAEVRRAVGRIVSAG